MAEGITITEVSVAPNTVYTGGSFVISIAVEDPQVWLTDSNDLFLTDSSGVFLLAKEA